MRSLNQPSSFSLFSRYPSEPLNIPARKTDQHHQDFSPSYSLFSSHLPCPLPAPTIDSIDPDLEKIDLILNKIRENLTHCNQSIPNPYKISEEDVKIILGAFFKTVDLSSRNSIFFDKNFMETNHSAVYFRNDQNQPCLFIKPNLKNTLFSKIPCFNTPVLSSGSEKMIKKTGFLIIFSDDLLTTIESYRCASFSKSFSKGKNQALRDYWETNCQRNGFSPFPFKMQKKHLAICFLSLI
jgi:hypothetical protein